MNQRFSQHSISREIYLLHHVVHKKMSGHALHLARLRVSMMAHRDVERILCDRSQRLGVILAKVLHRARGGSNVLRVIKVASSKQCGKYVRAAQPMIEPHVKEEGIR